MTRADVERQLTAMAAGLGDDELQVLVFVACRLAAGQEQYGRLDIKRDPRDWKRELGEEAADALVYSAILALAKGATS